MSVSQHPIALSIERRVGSSARLLAVMMCLPLVDGVFVAVVLGGALDSIAGILEVGLLVFFGSATAAVILAEMDESPREQMRIVLGVGAVVIAGAAIQAALAPTVESVLDMAVFERFAALVVLGVAASTASARLDEYLPGPLVILGFGLVASAHPAEASVAVQTDPVLVVQAVSAAGVGVLAALAAAATSPLLRTVVGIDRFRFGSAVALGVLALSIGGLVPSTAPLALAVLLVTGLLAFDPDTGKTTATDTDTRAFPDGGSGSAVAGGTGDNGSRGSASTSAESSLESDDDRTTGRPPWL